MNRTSKKQSPEIGGPHLGKNSDDSPNERASYLLAQPGAKPEETIYAEFGVWPDGVARRRIGGPGMWRIVVRLALDGERIVVRELALVPADDDNDLLTSTTFQEVRVGELRRKLTERLQDPATQWTFLPEHWRGKSLSLPKPGRRGHPESFYALWVERYVAALEREPKSPVKLLAEEHHYSRGQIRAWLDKAESLGLLVGRPKGTTGRAGGRMSAKCRKMLRGES